MVMVVYRPREIQKALLSKGFVTSQSHHTFLILMVDGKKSRVRTKLSHGSRTEYDDNLLSCVAKQLKIKKIELQNLIDCLMGYNEYVNLLQARGVKL